MSIHIVLPYIINMHFYVAIYNPAFLVSAYNLQKYFIYHSGQPPSTPENLEVLITDNLIWNSAFSEGQIDCHETYSIEVSNDSGMNWSILIDGLQGLDYQLDTLPKGIPYLLRVKAHNRFGYSKATNPVKFFRGNNDKFVITLIILTMQLYVM